ncbi:Glyoxylase, beta-lactamase superfamily II [Ignavigranum ruoffiae]|uniref:Glyoxylase, beta-lactamase superfamily II n=1 Tax=Ignavigranum ruoffiae TaxID=89093 RepID=A0A1H9GDF8_9LACT|nr:MBL fold metallo-hydrolase [Ignavigranum ruoffiae]SEQ48116.1 Glyoxylase, beta-lactamase superfamily II [Ignavigranum ruoffiae]
MFFDLEVVSPRIKRIKMPYVCAYYLEGDQAGLLIDTGWGYGNLKTFVDQLANKPYQVVLSHGHCDHGGGANQFDQVYLAEADLELEEYSCSLPVRQKIFSQVVSDERNVFDASIWQAQRQAPFRTLYPGQVFDLGGLTVTVEALPGHTLGSMAFWLEQEQTLITCDACAQTTYLNLPSSASVYELWASGRELQVKYPNMGQILTSHPPYSGPGQMLGAMVELADKILHDQDDRLLLKMRMEGQAYAAINKKLSPEPPMANIVYSMNKVKESIEQVS